MSFIDLEPAAQRMTELVRGVTTEHLEHRTPCADYAVADLLDHILGLSEAFTDAALKSALDRQDPPPEGDAAHLDVNWRDRIPEQLDALVHAWRQPDARTGITKAGGIEMPADVAAIVALEELTVHGWDLAQATRQPFAADDATLEAVIGFVSQFAGPDQAELRGSAYADPVRVAAEASVLDHAIALTGRDPAWPGHESPGAN